MAGWKSSKYLQRLFRAKFKIWQIFLILIILLAASAYVLRQNNLKMIELREAVIAADKEGRGVQESIAQLNKHVFSHMNTEIVRPVELVYTYNRQAKALIKEANKSSGRDIYAEATRVCERQGIPVTSIAQCAADYALDNNSNIGQTKITLPDKDLFTYTFASPIWTPDIAGFLVIFTGVALVWFIARTAEYIAVRFIIRHRLRKGL